MLVELKWTKTIQFRTRTLVIPYPRIRGHPLCPTAAAYNACRLLPGAPLQGPALVTRRGQSFMPLSSRTLVSKIRRSLPSEEDLHSFRRGGASWAYRQGVPADTIRQLGDWASNAYTAYILDDTASLSKALRAVTTDLPSQ